MAEPILARGERLREVALLFLKLGIIAFGGPAAHIAMMRREVVERREWVDDARFLDLLGASHLLPGPSSTELAIFLGYSRAGLWGLALAGTLFIMPAMLIVLALAWAYVRFGATPGVAAVLYGIKPVVIAIVTQALWGLGRTAVKGPPAAVLGAAVIVLFLFGVNPIVLLVLAGAVSLVAAGVWRRPPAVMLVSVLGVGSAVHVRAATGLLTLFLTFLKIGAVTYGSGYVLLAFLHDDIVTRLHILTDKQLVDAVAIGQVTPGPVFTTATFIGYVAAGVPGALLTTLAIFLPSFLLVALVYPVIGRLRSSPHVRSFLDGVNVAAVGLMAGVTLQLARASLIDPLTAALAVVSLAVLIRYKPNTVWMIAAGVAVGLAHWRLLS